MKRILAAVVLLLLVFQGYAQQARYVFFIIGDGMGINSVLGTQMFNAAMDGRTGVDELTFTQFPCTGFIKTHSATSLVTDSAAAGSALATGHKTFNGALGLDAQGNPVPSIRDKAAEMGYGTGVVTTVGVNHATPAAFYAKSKKRNRYSEIFQQMLDSDLDFAAGGDIMVTRNSNDTPQAMVKLARQKGWTVIQGKDIKNIKESKEKTLCIGGELGSIEMPYSIDKPEVSLADLTKAAIDNLSCNHPEGFFLMVEGGTIDHAAHNNDAATLFQEINAMDRAVDVVMEFYKAHPDETLVFVTADHETGGLCVGSGIEPAMKNLLHQKMSKNKINQSLGKLHKMKNPQWEDAKKIISETTGLWTEVMVKDMDAEEDMIKVFERNFIKKGKEVDENLYARNNRLTREVIDYLDWTAGVKFCHNDHSSAMVPVYAIGVGAERIANCRDNTDFYAILLELMQK